MSNIDYQNGFLCGIATRGLTRSGELYKPTVWNDSGVYSYFYIDFRHAMEDFSLGMLNESIIVYDSNQITITGIEYVSTGIYKLYGNISDRYHGITVLNKVTSRLMMADGYRVPPFSVHFYVSGIVSYIDLCYVYEHLILPDFVSGEITESILVDTSATDITVDSISESITFAIPVGTITESVSLVLT